jgi:hypothetical protein
MKSVVIALSLIAGLMLAAPAQAAAPAGTEKVKLSGRKGPSLFRPGFQVGEYDGNASIKSSKSSVSGVFEGDKASVAMTINGPGLGPVEVACGGGQSRLGLGWITFDRDKLDFFCTITGPGAGADASFALAQSRGASFLKSLQQPQRAAELWFGGVSVRARTEQVGGMPIGGGQVLGYVLSKDGVDIGAVDLGGGMALPPTFYLPPKGSKDRDAVAVMTLILWAFKDPGRQR